MRKKLIILFIVAFVFRFFLIFIAYHGDLNNNISWGNALLRYGANGFYEQKSWLFSAPNQPPLYILLFGLTSWIYQSITNLAWHLNNNVGIFPSSLVWFWQDHGMVILVKLPSILSDLGIGYLIYKLTKRFSLAVLWLFNPITWYNSSIWGQTDPIVNLLGLISIFFLFKKKLVPSMLFFIISVLFKGSLAIFLPVILVVWILQKHKLKLWIKAILISGMTVVLVTFAYHPYLDLPIWLFNLYTQRFFPGEIGDLSANAFNFWYLVNPGKVLDSTLYFGLPARIWGDVITSIAIIITIVRLQKQKTEKNILYSLMIVAMITFLFMTRIHERYLYPFFPIATILIGFIPELLIAYVILSITFLLNMYNLFWAPSIGVLEKTMQMTKLPVILTIINLLVFVFIIKLSTRKS